MKPAYNLKTVVPIALTVCGVLRETEADLVYHYLPAERGSREHGSGVQLEPDYAESIEIVSLKLDKTELCDLLTDKQTEAVMRKILGDE